ncbi:OTU domain-containing protein [Ananas comosus]|uniref:Ubiquitin thioesterase OTU n=1 Tax=Ananas comosus TaxID=4615 RepID=A0A199W1P3_ANACO|nr:OTU domain-containing protein [Ananas comosus]
MAGVCKPSNEVLLQQLKDGTAKFELLHLPNSPTSDGLQLFARISSSLGRMSPAMKKMEHYSVQKVTGDGRCMFRALVKGMARNKGITLSPTDEREDADDLRMAVKEIICDNDTERIKYEEALVAITVEESLNRYCQRIRRSDFWGGESELLVYYPSYAANQSLCTYQSTRQHSAGGWGNGFIPIAEYGSEFGKRSKKGKKRMPVRLLYSGKNHYDLLI